ncbi:hypothetical protein HK101_000399 [Irineochytrium annulatum]|nr:hypothetical protein HK101_000399 [Irineochytrium annulatum]
MDLARITLNQIVAWHRDIPRPANRPLLVGISGPQGSGKTTLVRALERDLAAAGLRACSLSLDDLYLTFDDQEDIAKQNPGNGLLRFRGNPGTHDLALGKSILDDLTTAYDENPQRVATPIKLPRYDKSLHRGRGDRSPESGWPTAEPPLDVILFEGWCLGFEAVDSDAALDSAIASAPETSPLRKYDRDHVWLVQRSLEVTARALWDRCDAFVRVRCEDWKFVYKWRREQERALAGEVGEASTLTPEEVDDFVDRFMVVYVLNGDRWRRRGEEGRVLSVVIDEKRGVTSHHVE